MPDLVARLSGLHTTLASRLSLHESLLLLNGRLDMVLSQVEMRSSAAPAPVAARKRSQGANKEKAVKRYVEGESDEEADDQMDVEVESGDDAGSIEDVELGGESEEEEDDDEDEGEEHSESDEEGGPALNGFIDDEAEEDFEEDEEDDYSE